MLVELILWRSVYHDASPLDYLSLSLLYMGLYMFNWPVLVEVIERIIHSSCHYHHQIGSINLTHNYHIFRGCEPEMFVTSYAITYCIYIHSGNTGILFSLLLCSLWWVQIVGNVLAWWSCLFVCTLHHLIIIIVQIYLKTLNLCVSKIKHNFSVIHYTIYGAVCFQFTHFPYDDWENIHFVLLSSSNRKYELLPIV